MLIYSLIPLLLAIVFPIMASGCAELPNSKTKKCPYFYYGSLSMVGVLVIILFINLLLYPKAQTPQTYYALPKWEFWTCYAVLFMLNCCGLWEVNKNQALLSKQEKSLSVFCILLGFSVLALILMLSIFM